MGLHIQCHQEVPSKLKLRVTGPLCADHDGAIHGRIRETADQDLS